jgi:hypothetical protein
MTTFTPSACAAAASSRTPSCIQITQGLGLSASASSTTPPAAANHHFDAPRNSRGRENIAQKKPVPFVILLFGYEPALISGAVNSINANFIDPWGSRR